MNLSLQLLSRLQELNLKVVIEQNAIDYIAAMQIMKEEVLKVQSGVSGGLVWLLEHHPVYTLGTSENTLNNDQVIAGIPVINTDRGGKITYHGYGQRVVYLVVDLKKLFNSNVPDIKQYVLFLEEIVITILKFHNINGIRLEGKNGVWVASSSRPEKISALGVRVSKGVAMHGFSINICVNLGHFASIVPCGIKDYGVCSLDRLTNGKLGVDFLDDDIIKTIKITCNY